MVGTEFTNVSNDDIEEVWRDHVATLLKGKSEAAAVNTMFLLNRLFLVSVCLMQYVLLMSSTSRLRQIETCITVCLLLTIHLRTHNNVCLLCVRKCCAEVQRIV